MYVDNLTFNVLNLDSAYNFDPKPHIGDLKFLLSKIQDLETVDTKSLHKVLKMRPKHGEGFYSKDELISGYRYLIEHELIQVDKGLEDKLKMKPIRTQSGVATVTVLTKPFPCPGKCIFCPNDVRMPKSYLSDEPGAQRAERNNFDPYLQTFNRLTALENIGHNTDKLELIVLGGTWSFYPEKYQIWFIKECFRAMNDFGVRDGREHVEAQNIFEEADKIPAQTESGRNRSYNEIIDEVEKNHGESLISEREMCDWDELIEQHKLNENADSRCVGLVIETRPDYIDEEEVIKIRRLGATKVQIGIQSLQDDVMLANMRGHGRSETVKAIQLLRLAGFKIHAHWMPNLYGSDVQKDIADYQELWHPNIRPDELKIYPTSIIGNTELYELYKRGKYRPYTYEQLLEVLTKIMPTTPRYCRLTRVVRDIPSTDIVAGNKLTNFRQIAEEEITNQGKKCECIRCREIRDIKVVESDLQVEVIGYDTGIGKELFISYRTIDSDKICGFLRLALPDHQLSDEHFMPELQNKAIIREVHVYGKVVGIGKKHAGRSQHLGLGTRMIKLALEEASNSGYNQIAVISAIGTKEYYRKLGFKESGLYMSRTTKQ